MNMQSRLLLLAIVMGLAMAAYYYQANQAAILRTETAPSVGLAITPTPGPRPTVKPVISVGSRIKKGVAGYEYIAVMPQNYGTVLEKWPILIFLHGQGGGSNVENFLHFGPIKYAVQHEDLPMIVVAPATKEGWSTAHLDTFLNSLPFPGVDPDRIYLTGHSMGGHATWRWSIASPEKFAAVIPFAGAGSPRDARKRFKHVGVWIFHGMKDDIVPVKNGMVMAGALKDEGLPVKYTIYPEGDHGSVLQGYDDPELYKWMLEQHRPSAKKETHVSLNTNQEFLPTPTPKNRR